MMGSLDSVYFQLRRNVWETYLQDEYFTPEKNSEGAELLNLLARGAAKMYQRAAYT